jgi:hypothetical protein
MRAVITFPQPGSGQIDSTRFGRPFVMSLTGTPLYVLSDGRLAFKLSAVAITLRTSCMLGASRTGRSRLAAALVSIRYDGGREYHRPESGKGLCLLGETVDRGPGEAPRPFGRERGQFAVASRHFREIRPFQAGMQDLFSGS